LAAPARAEPTLDVPAASIPADGADLPPGSWVAQYQVLECLGRGGMGRVYRAFDSRLRRPVALKFLAARLVESAQARVRFLRAARAASALDHPNLATVHDIGEHEGQPFLVLTLYEGETLRERLVRGPLELREAWSILSQLAAGLHAAHEAGIVHRDLKPA